MAAAIYINCAICEESSCRRVVDSAISTYAIQGEMARLKDELGAHHNPASAKSQGLSAGKRTLDVPNVPGNSVMKKIAGVKYRRCSCIFQVVHFGICNRKLMIEVGHYLAK